MNILKRWIGKKIQTICREIPRDKAVPGALYFVEPVFSEVEAQCIELCDILFTEKRFHIGAHGNAYKVLSNIETLVGELSPASAMSKALKYNILTMWIPYLNCEHDRGNFWAEKHRQVFLLKHLVQWFLGP